MAAQVLDRTDERHALGLELVDVPVGIEQTQIHHAHIGAYAFHFLVVPERKCVIVAVCEKDGARLAGLQHVIGVVPGNVVPRTVVLRPVSAQHHAGNRGGVECRAHRFANTVHQIDFAVPFERFVRDLTAIHRLGKQHEQPLLPRGFATRVIAAYAEIADALCARDERVGARRHLADVVVGPSVGIVMQIVELADAGDAREEHFHERHPRDVDGRLVLGLELGLELIDNLQEVGASTVHFVNETNSRYVIVVC